jgi:hypothetical protein
LRKRSSHRSIDSASHGGSSPQSLRNCDSSKVSPQRTSWSHELTTR